MAVKELFETLFVFAWTQSKHRRWVPHALAQEVTRLLIRGGSLPMQTVKREKTFSIHERNMERNIACTPSSQQP